MSLEAERAMDDLAAISTTLVISSCDLLGRAEDVGVVLRERAHAREAVQHARPLVAVQPPKSAKRSGSSRYERLRSA